MNEFDLAWHVLKQATDYEQYRPAYLDAKSRGYRFGFEQFLIQAGVMPVPSIQKALPKSQMFMSPTDRPRRMDQQSSPVSLGTAHPAILPYLRQQAKRSPSPILWDEDRPNLRVADKVNPEFFNTEDFFDRGMDAGDRGQHVNEIEASQGIHEKLNPGIREGKWGEEEGFKEWGPNTTEGVTLTEDDDYMFPLSELQAQRQADARGTGDNEYSDVDYDVTGRGPMENRAAENTRQGKLDTQWYIDNYDPEEPGEDLMQDLLENDPATQRLGERKQREKEATRLSREGEQSAVLRDIMEEHEPDSTALLGEKEDADLTGVQLASRNRAKLMDEARQMAERRGMDPMGAR